MGPGTLKHPLVFMKNAAFRFNFTYKAGSPLLPVDLTGSAARLQVRSFDRTQVYVDMSTANAGITLGSDGSVACFLSLAACAALTFDKGEFDFLYIPSGQDPYNLFKGFAITMPGDTVRL